MCGFEAFRKWATKPGPPSTQRIFDKSITGFVAVAD